MIVAKLKTLLAGLSVTVMVVLGAVLVFAGGEIREGMRAACTARSAGWLTRHTCDLFNVRHQPPVEAIALPDSDAAERADRHVAPECTTGQGLELIDFKTKDEAELERLLNRDLDGDQKVGHVTPRLAEGFKLGAAPDLILADKDEPPLPRGGRVVATVPSGGGATKIEVIPVEVPKWEWMHVLEYQLSGDLPVNGKKAGDALELSARWTFARAHALHLGVEPYFARLSAAERAAVGKETDWGVNGVLHVRCRGLLDCKAE